MLMCTAWRHLRVSRSQARRALTTLSSSSSSPTGSFSSLRCRLSSAAAAGGGDGGARVILSGNCPQVLSRFTELPQQLNAALPSALQTRYTAGVHWRLEKENDANDGLANGALAGDVRILLESPNGIPSRSDTDTSFIPSKVPDNHAISHDFRVFVNDHDDMETVVSRAIDALTLPQQFVSTRGYTGKGEDGSALDFLDVVREGLAPDRGLFVAPRFLPFSDLSQLESLAGLSYQERALRVMERFPLGRLKPAELQTMIYSAYSNFSSPDVMPTTALEGSQYLMETFHGPTASFKDLSLQLTPKILGKAMSLAKPDPESGVVPRAGLLVATSGDTGTAALDGFAKEGDMPVIVLYPQNGVSLMQMAQMVQTTGTVSVMGVDGDFDFCQKTIKDILQDEDIQAVFSSLIPGLTMSSANSINFGRFLPQVAFTFSGYLDLWKQGRIQMGDVVDVCIPTGNFGNILGAVYAREMGLPIGQLICASNENNILTDFIETGKYDLRGREFHVTVSPSIDILVSSNLERFLHLVSGGDCELVSSLFTQLDREGHFEIDSALHQRVRELVTPGWAGQDECLETIGDTFQRTGTFIDPHTAVAKRVVDKLLPSTRDGEHERPVLISSTAHFGKFPMAMLQALGGESAQLALENNTPLTEIADKDIAPRVRQLLDAMMKHEPKNSMHPGLEQLAKRDVHLNNRVPADKEEIVGEMFCFLQALAWFEGNPIDKEE